MRTFVVVLAILLRDHTGSTVASRDLAGKPYLIWFYPKAMTPGCTAEGGALRDEFTAFQARGVEVLGVSFDQPATTRRSSASSAFPSASSPRIYTKFRDPLSHSH